ncbi:MAG: hypothetical protein Q3X50_06180 [Sutterella sp.]|uniref:hypothetical protein n=1 Tax=Sutterella sp. TaxID=1981025 RepID=UPI002841D50B|nr:hypothetical protein [Sutterella sp.]MDR3928123.1 hypothetical protein [Sutterella sp.]
MPSGEAVLVDRATGVRLRLSAESGPLRLGSVTLDFAVEPKGLNAPSGRPGEVPGAQAASLSVPTVSQDCGQTAPDPALVAFERMQRLPPGFGANPAEAFGEGPMPTSAGHSPVRVLDAPLEGLTREEFEETLAALVRRRDDVERETEFLQEIEADPLDIDDLKTELSKIDQQFSAVSKRFSDWERLQKRIDEEHAADTF